MKRIPALLTALALGLGLASCTPKPAAADPVAEDFLTALMERDSETLAELVDSPDRAQRMIDASYDGLQAEALEATLDEVTVTDNFAAARYTLDWTLPRDRSLRYETSMTLTRTGGDWTVRWQIGRAACRERV